MKCACGVEVDPDALARAVGDQIDEGETVESVECSYCSACSELDDDNYVFQIVVE